MKHFNDNDPDNKNPFVGYLSSTDWIAYGDPAFILNDTEGMVKLQMGYVFSKKQRKIIWRNDAISIDNGNDWDYKRSIGKKIGTFIKKFASF